MSVTGKRKSNVNSEDSLSKKGKFNDECVAGEIKSAGEIKVDEIKNDMMDYEIKNDYRDYENGKDDKDKNNNNDRGINDENKFERMTEDKKIKNNKKILVSSSPLLSSSPSLSLSLPSLFSFSSSSFSSSSLSLSPIAREIKNEKFIDNIKQQSKVNFVLDEVIKFISLSSASLEIDLVRLVPNFMREGFYLKLNDGEIVYLTEMSAYGNFERGANTLSDQMLLEESQPSREEKLKSIREKSQPNREEELQLGREEKSKPGREEKLQPNREEKSQLDLEEKSQPNREEEKLKSDRENKSYDNVDYDFIYGDRSNIAKIKKLYEENLEGRTLQAYTPMLVRIYSPHNENDNGLIKTLALMKKTNKTKSGNMDIIDDEVDNLVLTGKAIIFPSTTAAREFIKARAIAIDEDTILNLAWIGMWKERNKNGRMIDDLDCKNLERNLTLDLNKIWPLVKSALDEPDYYDVEW